MFKQAVSLVRRHIIMVALAFALVAVATPGLVSRAADPTDAAGLLGGLTPIFTAFPILTIGVTALAIAGVAMYLVRRGAKSVR